MSDNQELTITDLEVACMLLFCMIIAYVVTKFQFNYLPESGATMIVGMAAGAIARFVLDKEVSFDSTFFYYFLLPPIIFDAGYSLKRRDFFSNIGSILTFAVFGTLITSVLIGGGIYVLSAHTSLNALNSTDIVDSLVFGSLLSAIDPVAALSVLGNLNVDPLLYSLVFGEAVLNDAVSIALVKSFLQFSENEEASVVNIFKAIGNFVLVSVGSFLIGFAVALISAFAYKRVNLKHHPYFETSMLLVLAYISFLVAEAATLSGLISLFFCGLTVAHYTFYSLSNVSRIAFGHTSKTLTFISETVVYLYLGLHAFSKTNADYNVGFIVVVVIIVIFTRFFAVVPLSFILNRFRKVKISFNMQCMMSFAGLRGAIAYSLASSLPTCAPNDPQCTLNTNALISTTNVVVLFTTLVLGCLTEPVLRLFKINRVEPSGHDGKDEDPVDAVSKPDFDSDVSRALLNPEPKKRTRFHAVWIRIDERFMKPMFGGRSRQRNVAVTSDSEIHEDAAHDTDPADSSQVLIDSDHSAEASADSQRHFTTYLSNEQAMSAVSALASTSPPPNADLVSLQSRHQQQQGREGLESSYALLSDDDPETPSALPSLGRQQSVSTTSSSIAPAAFNYYYTADDVERESRTAQRRFTEQRSISLRSATGSAAGGSFRSQRHRSKLGRDIPDSLDTVNAVLDEARATKDYRVRSGRDVVVDSNISAAYDVDILDGEYESDERDDGRSLLSRSTLVSRPARQDSANQSSYSRSNSISSKRANNATSRQASVSNTQQNASTQLIDGTVDGGESGESSA